MHFVKVALTVQLGDDEAILWRGLVIRLRLKLKPPKLHPIVTGIERLWGFVALLDSRMCRAILPLVAG